MEPAADKVETPAPAPGGRASARPRADTRLHRRVALVTAGVLAVAVSAVTLSSYLSMRDQLLGALQQKATALVDGGAIALSSDAILTKARAQSWCDQLGDREWDLAYVLVRDPAGRVIASVSSPGFETERERGETTHTRGLIPEPVGGSIELGLDRNTTLSRARTTLWDAIKIGVALLVVFAAFGGWATLSLIGRVGKVAETASLLARGDLRVVPQVSGDDEIGSLGRSMEELVQGLRRMVGDLQGASEAIGRQALAVAETATAQLGFTREQATALDGASAQVREVSQASRQAAESARYVIDVADRSETLWKDGGAAVQEGLLGLKELDGRVADIALAVTELSERMVEIAGTVSTLRDLAEQTNVLALNASIEASKVGEEGKGFAVVAGEMRKLAERSRRSAEEVRGALAELQRSTRQVVTATQGGSERARTAVAGAERAESTISALATALEDTSKAARGIADVSRRQTEEMDRIAGSVEGLRGKMSQTLDGAERLKHTAGDMTRVASRLASLVAAYRR
ncbi:MAG: methyl-accepting chemotaxis protein [Anaeromyxobacter sp.]